MNLTDTNYHWKNKMGWIFDTWWDKILQPQKWTFWERDSKKLNNITVLHFMTTFHNTALKIETSFKLQRCLSPFWKLEKSMKKVKTYWNMLKMQDNHHFRLNIATDKSTSLDLRKMGLYFKTLSSCKTAFYGWIRLSSISWETKTPHKISSRNSTLGDTMLFFLVYGKDGEKNRVNRSAK